MITNIVQSTSGVPPPAMRRPRNSPMRMFGPPPLPPLAAIVMNRAAFGPRPGDMEAFAGLGANDDARLAAFVDAQLSPASLADTECDQRLSAQSFVSLNKSLTQLWADYVMPPQADRNLPIEEVRAAALLRMIYSRRQLFEVLVEFWHNHFSIYGWDYRIESVWPDYDRNVIRANALGNFRALLGGVAAHPAMLYYVDNAVSSRAGPNENWGRELFELHTLGSENYGGVHPQAGIPGYAAGLPEKYVDADVYEATRAFTGWRVNDNTWEQGVQNTGAFLYYDSWHDRFQKTILGLPVLPADQAPMADGNAILDKLAAHPGTGRFIARKLCRRLVADAPPEALVDGAAALFTSLIAVPDQIAQVVRFILLSPEFRATWGEKIKRPIEAAIGAIRATSASFKPISEFFWYYDAMGQPMFGRRSPEGWSDVRDAWVNTTSMLHRWRFANWLIEKGIKTDQTDVTVDVVAQMPVGVRTPNAIVDFWVQRLLGRPMHPASSHEELVDFLAQGRNPAFDLTLEQIAERLPRMVGLLLMSPDFQWR